MNGTRKKAASVLYRSTLCVDFLMLDAERENNTKKKTIIPIPPVFIYFAYCVGLV